MAASYGDRVLLPLLVAAAAATSPVAGTYTGTTSEHEPVRLVVKGGFVVRATASVDTYRCDPHGDLGGQTVERAVRVRFRGGAFRFDAGPMPQYLKMTGAVSGKHTIRGRLRVHGTIGTGDPCTSRAVRYTVTRR